MEVDRIVPDSKALFPYKQQDLDLIDALWKQDVDLGVGKEVYDPSLRQELERERELELLKQKEKIKSQLAAREREERARQEQYGRWLKENFKRDGETGEWVKVQNASNDRQNDTTIIQTNDRSNVDDSMTLEAALDYISSGLDPDLFNFENNDGQATSAFQNLSVQQNPLAEFQDVQAQPEHPTQLFHSQNSLEESLNGLVDYINMTNSLSDSNQFAVGGIMPEVQEYKPDISSPVELCMQPEVDTSSVLFQNATMPTPGVEISNNFGIAPTPCELNVSAVQQANTLNTTMDLGLDSLDFFDDLPNLPEGAVDELDLAGVDFLLDMENAPDMIDEDIDMPAFDSINLIPDNHSDSSGYINGSPHQDFTDEFAGLEGATGGSDFSNDLDGPNNKLSRLSESSNDSGIVYHDGFSSSSSSSSSSSYTESPANSNHGNSSTASNDTEHDPHRKGALAHHVAHNHTYNTLPGQIPREVKKYAHKEPSKKGPHSRDQKRASELKVPFTVNEIIDSPVDTFNDMLTRHKLTETQLTLVRDIRRRGKNKVAAQNCRKRKVHVIVSLSDDLTDLEKERDRLAAERAEMEKETRIMKDRFSYLYTHIFQSLRDERGEPYDPSQYSLQQSSDGNVFLVPRNMSNHHSGPEGDSKGGKKRKSSDI